MSNRDGCQEPELVLATKKEVDLVSAYPQSAIGHGAILVREFREGDEDAFARLNQAWIEKYFRLEDKDRGTLQNPRKHIIEGGGQIFLALSGAQIVGCVAIIGMDSRTYEIVKMAVDESFQGQGIGRALIKTAISWAKAHGVRRLWLETNHVLSSAIRLYESCGFTHLSKERYIPSPYQRSDLQMELWLEGLDSQSYKRGSESSSVSHDYERE